MNIDLGGNIMDRYAEVQHAQGPIEGICASACTMRLLHDCVMPDAILMFHSSGNEIADRIMRGTYPFRVKFPSVMRGAEAIRRGARKCGEMK